MRIRLEKKYLASITTVCVAVATVLATPVVDFDKETGKIRRELHSSGFGPMICSCPGESIAAINSMHFLNARTHDWALINPAERVCDYYHIFPLMHLDAKDPANYHFGPTDYLFKRVREETKLGIFFRLGTSIEHSGGSVHFNTLIPQDFDKVAETFAGTIRHYNRGWANGFKWNIQYWEIWNEPDGENNMWCEPGGDAGKAKQRREKFIKFFVTVLKRLKSEFPDVKVGGPALCWMNGEYFKELLLACKAAGVAPDFISWHSYSSNPDGIMRMADDARALCDSLGFNKCELIINEWHFFGNYNWSELRSPDPAVQERVLNGPGAHNGIDAACFTLATLAKFQTSKYDQAYYYGCRHNGSWGFKDANENKYKTYYALKLFGDIVTKYPKMCAVTGTQKGDPLAFAVRSEDGKKRGLLVVDYMGKGTTLKLQVKGVAGMKASAKVLDFTHNLESASVALNGEELVLTKCDNNSAAFFVTFRSQNSNEQEGWRILDPQGKAYLGLATQSISQWEAIQTLDRAFSNGVLRLTADILAPAKWYGGAGQGTSLRVVLSPEGSTKKQYCAVGPDFQGGGRTGCFALSRLPNGNALGLLFGMAKPNTWYRYQILIDLGKGTYSGKVTEAATGAYVGKLDAMLYPQAIKPLTEPVRLLSVRAKGMAADIGDDFNVADAGGVDNVKLEWQAPQSQAFETVYTCDYRTKTGASKTTTLWGDSHCEPSTLTVDFARETGTVNKWLHCAGMGPRSYPRSLENDDEAIRSFNLTAARTHDWALFNNGQLVVDTQHVFPLLHADAKNPNNYVFKPTDHLLELSQNVGMKIFYRMGSSIEHTGKWAYNALNPTNHEQYAEALAGIVRHYTQGWANGYKWDIQNWEIWNEPDGAACWRGTRAEFIHLYVTVLKRLKTEFPNLNFGGPALSWLSFDYFRELLLACKKAGVEPDFVSWHYYGNSPETLISQPAKMRKFLDDLGFKKCKMVIDEWHYILTWDGIHGASSPEKIRQAHTGPSAHNGIDSATFNLAVLAGFQNTCLDQSYYYGCGAKGNWGFKDNYGMLTKSAYSLQMFGKIIKDYPRKVFAESQATSVTVFGALSQDQKRGALLVSDYRGKSPLVVDVAGVPDPKNVKAIVLDYTRNLENVSVNWQNGVLRLPRRDGNSAAFLVTFEK